MKIIADLHTHSLVSGHAYSSPMENIRHASLIGLKYLGQSEHAPNMIGAPNYIYFLNLKRLPNQFENLKILKSCELNILNDAGDVDLEDYVISKLDYCIASFHVIVYEGSYQADKLLNAYRIVLKNEKIKIIGHPEDERFKIDYKQFVAEVKKANKIIEVNNASLDFNSPRKNANTNIKEILKECALQKCYVIVNSDAHSEFEVGSFDNAIKILEEVNFPKELIINEKGNEEYFKKYFNLD